MITLSLLAFLASGAEARADELRKVLLADGRALQGRVEALDDTGMTLELPQGRVRVPLDQIVSLVPVDLAALQAQPAWVVVVLPLWGDAAAGEATRAADGVRYVLGRLPAVKVLSPAELNGLLGPTRAAELSACRTSVDCALPLVTQVGVTAIVSGAVAPVTGGDGAFRLELRGLFTGAPAAQGAGLTVYRGSALANGPALLEAAAHSLLLEPSASSLSSLPPILPVTVEVSAGPTVNPGAGDLYVSSTPPGAAIWLDGAPVGAVTPFVLRGLALGEHAVEARTPCERGATRVTLTEDTIARAELTLDQRPGSLVVTGGPPGGRVFLDGVELGFAPITLPAVACGPHRVAVRAAGYIEATGVVTVTGGEPLRLVLSTSDGPAPPASDAGGAAHLILRREELGTLVLDVSPLQTRVTVDGVEIGAGPRSVPKVAAGMHTVSGALEGYQPRSVDVLIAPDAVTRAELRLQPEPRPSRRESGRAPVGRVLLNVGVSAVGLGATGYGVHRLLDATAAYERYLAAPVDAQAIYDQEVVPARTEAMIAGGVGFLGVAASSGLWITTEF